jgi:hypothetical protein
MVVVGENFLQRRLLPLPRQVVCVRGTHAPSRAAFRAPRNVFEKCRRRGVAYNTRGARAPQGAVQSFGQRRKDRASFQLVPAANWTTKMVVLPFRPKV